MAPLDRKKHWETIYQTKQPDEVSWYQPTPETSLRFIEELNLKPDARIIDIGGGDSLLAEHLLDLGFQNITVVDISKAAIERAKKRIGKQAETITWVVADVTQFEPTEDYDLWHDRAAFHFLTEQQEIHSYLETAHKSITPDGIMVVGTFSKEGPEKCSGLPVSQYSESSMTKQMQPLFEKIECITVNHETPFDTVQNFTFCSFKKG